MNGAGELWCDQIALYHSYVHLHCNRLLGTDPQQESTALGLLLRVREGLARCRPTGTATRAAKSSPWDLSNE